MSVDDLGWLVAFCLVELAMILAVGFVLMWWLGDWDKNPKR